MAVLTRDVLAEQLAERAEITMAAARDEVKWFFETLSGALTGGDEVRIHGFGTFKTAQRAARTGRNPRTGESVQVPARRVVRFSPSTTLSASLKASRGGPARKKSTAKK
jgi:nucleoid DNA-binding protein